VCRGSFPRGKARPGRDDDHSLPLVPRSGMIRSYPSPPCRLHDDSGTALFACYERSAFTTVITNLNRGSRSVGQVADAKRIWDVKMNYLGYRDDK
jgi:hypothetical protein